MHFLVEMKYFQALAPSCLPSLPSQSHPYSLPCHLPTNDAPFITCVIYCCILNDLSALALCQRGTDGQITQISQNIQLTECQLTAVIPLDCKPLESRLVFA